MIRNRKETAWKKNRKLGDVKGGRTSPKISDRVFKRYHSIEKPSKGEELPIYIEDNPSRDFIHPVTISEIEEYLKKMPKKETEMITHIWLRKVKKSDYEKGETYQACFIRGSGVNLIVMNAFPKSLRMYFTEKKPSKKIVKFYNQWESNWDKLKNVWYLQWTTESIKKYYLEHLLLHEIGHLIDSDNKRFYSNTNNKKREDFANNYAAYWNNETKSSINYNKESL